jgi:poly(beta-D-mannuronate) lyase
MLLSLLCSAAVSAKSYTVRTRQQFNTVAATMQLGDAIIIANGTYTGWAATILTAGTAAQPITIKAETVGKVIFTGSSTETVFKLTGKYITICGITFAGCNLAKAGKQSGVLVEMYNTIQCRLTQCNFTRNEVTTQYTPLVIVSGKGQNNRVDHCSFISNINNQEVQVKVTKEECPQYTLIDHNEFKDKAKVTWSNSNGGECVQIGQDPVLLGTAAPFTTVRNNYFVKCNGEPEVISNKCSGNKYIRNLFEDCEGELVMRGGHNCLIDSNLISGGTGGIRVNGTGHILTHNQISKVKTGIRLMYGMGSGKQEIGFYIAAANCTVTNNTIKNCTTAILIGDSKNADWAGKFDTKRYPSRTIQDVAPVDNIIADNTFIEDEATVVIN